MRDDGCRHRAFVRPHARSWPRNRVIVRRRRPGNGGGRLGDRGSGRTLDLPPQVARVRGRFREHARGVLELRTRHPISPQDHSPARVLHRHILRAVGLDPPKLAERADERRIGHPEPGRAAVAAAGRACTEEGDTERPAGAYHAGKARHEAAEGQRRAVWTDCGEKPPVAPAYRQQTGTQTAVSAFNRGIEVAIHLKASTYESL